MHQHDCTAIGLLYDKLYITRRQAGSLHLDRGCNVIYPRLPVSQLAIFCRTEGPWRRDDTSTAHDYVLTSGSLGTRLSRMDLQRWEGHHISPTRSQYPQKYVSWVALLCDELSTYRVPTKLDRYFEDATCLG